MGHGRHPGDPGDLDAALGRLALEAARRRADPAFPVDADVRMGRELDDLAPGPRDPQQILRELLAAATAPGTPARSTPLFRRRRQRPEEVATDEAAVLAAEALAGVLERLARLERRPRAEPGGGPASLRPPPGWDAPALLGDSPARWASGGGRVCWVGADALGAVARLRLAGVDAYGIDSGDPPAGASIDVRPGEALGHLRAVGDDALRAVVLSAPAAPGDSRADLLAQARRVAAQLVIVSPRPVTPDEWAAGLVDAGWQPTVADHGAAAAFTVRAERPG